MRSHDRLVELGRLNSKFSIDGVHPGARNLLQILAISLGLTLLALAFIGAVIRKVGDLPLWASIYGPFGVCISIMIIIGLPCWYLAATKNPPRRVIFFCGLLIVFAAAELHLIVELAITTVDRAFASANPGPIVISGKVIYSIFSNVVQFGVAALGGSICASAILQRS